MYLFNYEGVTGLDRSTVHDTQRDSQGLHLVLCHHIHCVAYVPSNPVIYISIYTSSRTSTGYLDIFFYPVISFLTVGTRTGDS